MEALPSATCGDRWIPELVVVPGARHIDLYDRTDLIPLDTLETFLEQLD